MKAGDLDSAVDLLCKRFEWHCDVEILIVGGAAAMLTGLLGPDRVTADCDVIDYDPGVAWTAIELLADRIGRELGLPENWFNSKVQIRHDCLPPDWKKRRQLIRSGDRLWIYAIGRPDLIAMKFIAHRTQDLEDLDKLKITSDDIKFVRRYLDELPAKGTSKEQILETVEILNSLTVAE